MTSGEITTMVCGILPALAAFILTLRHGWAIQDLKRSRDSHNLQLSRLAKHEPRERHCSSVAQINKALETQDRLHHPKYPHHKP